MGSRRECLVDDVVDARFKMLSLFQAKLEMLAKLRLLSCLSGRP